MSQPTVHHAAAGELEEAATAAYRVTLGLTLAVSAVRIATETASERLDLVFHLPALVVLAGWLALGRGHGIRSGISVAAGYAAALVWITVLPAARSEALLVPAFMALACLAAVGGLRWAWRWLTTEPEHEMAEPEAWIEEDDGPRV